MTGSQSQSQSQPQLKRIPNFPNYLLTPEGNVFSLKSRIWLKPNLTGTSAAQLKGQGLFMYCLSHVTENGNKRQKNITVRRLLLQTYGPAVGYTHKQHYPPPLPSFVPTDRQLKEILEQLDEEDGGKRGEKGEKGEKGEQEVGS